MTNNRNKPCWCGSNKKYKHCHLGREEKKPTNHFEVNNIIKSSKKKLCCVPESYTQKCNGKIIKAHTVSKSSSLKKISRDGHVYKTLPDLTDIHRTKGNTKPKLTGINLASTFTGFCSQHDKELFSPIENQPFNWTKEQLFLVAYRAFCYEWYAKNQVSNSEEMLRLVDSGKNLADQILIQSQFEAFFLGLNAGCKDQEVYKSVFDEILITKDYSKIKYVGFELNKPPSVMGTGGFCPLQDFLGARLQDLTNLSKISQPIYYASFSSEDKGVFCLIWLDGYGDACEKYSNSYLKIPDMDKPHEMITMMFDHSENIFLKPEWWEGLTKECQQNLNDRCFESSSISTSQKLDTLPIADWHITKTMTGL